MKTLSNKRGLLALLAVVLLALVVLSRLFSGGDEPAELTLGEFIERVESGEVSSATILDRSNTIEGDLTDGEAYSISYPREYADELTELLASDRSIDIETDNQRQSFWANLLLSLLPILVLVCVFLFVFQALQGKRGMFSFGKSKARRFDKDAPQVTFDDVAGSDEAVEELTEIRDFLKDPERFQALGARIPKGVLLFGPPGTGKTLLARAVAGEAGVPFFSISGSDFVEMFVGVGASRVRDLFEQAKEEAPAIVFIDEIDAVGRHRGAGLGGGHDEREQTLNQLLVEMDGFDATTGVILIAATNRPDILDPALLRPGRFDRQIVIDRPDLVGRQHVLRVHAKEKPIAADVDLDVIAKRTPGFTGADLANLLNEAALLTARGGDTEITVDHIDSAIDRVIGGPERKSRVMSDHERRVIAYHEAGHALVGHVLQHTDPIHKVSIVSRGRALGWTLTLPERDKYLKSRSELRSELAMLLGGRTAEEMIFGDPTTGAADDIDRVTKIAQAMVTRYGMSDKLGPRKFGNQSEEVFLGKEGVGNDQDYSESVAHSIDSEVAELVDVAHREAQTILRHHRTTLEALAEALIEQETLDETQLKEILGDAGTWNSNEVRSTRSSAPFTSDPAGVGEYRAEEPPSAP